ncbi:MAG: hypothetical protein MUP09_04580 [Thiovulaceae bacterium]|nr:hypothetical protein [Sulfurimonadaceae bacterium]
MRSIRLMVVACIASGVVYAGQIDGGAVLGSAIGAATGAAVGSAVGGTNGAIIGGGAGGAIGAAVGSSQTATTVVTHERVVYVDRHHDNGKHKGQYKHKRHHGHDD